MKSNSIVLELQELASNPDSNVEELLNKTLMVARKLKLEDLRQWCDLELGGYINNLEKLPEYRKFYGELHTFQAAKIHLSDEDKKQITHIHMHYPLNTVQNLITNTKKVCKWSYSEMMESLNSEEKNKLESIRKQFNFNPSLCYEPIKLSQMISSIRGFILNYSLTLEENGILGEGIQFSKKEQEKAMSNQFNIQNMQGIIGNISGGNVQQQIHDGIHITQGDFDALADFLSKQGIPYSELQDLKEALDKDEHPQQANQFGKNVSQWIGNIIGKIASGTINLSLATASGLLTNAISQYYGLNG